jgi:hypothetical protein
LSWLDAYFQTGYKTIAIAGVPVAAEPILNFVSGATAADNPGLGRTDVTISGGGGGGGVTWQLGTDTAYTVTGTSGTQFVVIPTLTAARVWTAPTAPTDGMQFGLDDRNSVLVDAGNTLSVTTAGGTDHFIIGGVDKGTTWQVPASLFKGGMPVLTRRALSSTWELT